MLRLLLFISVCCIATGGFCQKLRYQNGTSHEDLIRNLKIRTVAAYIYFFRKEGSLDSTLNAITNYDSLENIAEYRTYRNGKMWAKTVYEFQNNRLVSKEEYLPEVKETLMYEYTYKTAGHKMVERIRSKKYSHTTVKVYFYKGDNLLKVYVK